MNVVISDHALIRYIERVHGLNLDPLRKEIETIVKSGAATEARNVINGGFIYSIKRCGQNCTVITVLSTEMREKSRGWKPKRNQARKVAA